MTIVFDLDGTLMDTLQDLWLSTNYALRAHNLAERSIKEVRQFVGNGVHKLIERAVPEEISNEMIEKVFATFKEHYVIHCQEHTDLYPGIKELLVQLKKEGHSLAVVSNKLQSGVDELHHNFFNDTIDVAIGERAGIPRKPAPDMVILALRELEERGVKIDNPIYIGDSEVDLQTAKNSNLPCISVLWGFRDKDLLEKKGASVFAETPEDIITIINSY